MLETAALLMKGTDTAAEYEKGLEGKRVAIVCKSVQMEELNNSGMARALRIPLPADKGQQQERSTSSSRRKSPH